MSSDSSGTTYSTPSDLEIVVTRVLDAPRTLVWEAWTRPEHVSNWLLGPPGWTMPVCEIDLRPGGGWRYVLRHEDGSEMTLAGTYTEITPPERLVGVESWGDDWPETVTTVVFTERSGKTTVTQSIRYPSPEARDAALKTGMKDGLDRSFNRLDGYLRTLA